LDPNAPKTRQILSALELAEDFSKDPRRFPDVDLVAKAIPAWTLDHMDVTPAWARALQTQPSLWLRARPETGPALAARLGDCGAAGQGVLADALRYCGKRDLFQTEEFQKGEFEIQDLHSQAVGWLCQPKPGETWWDACAGVGGKTLHLSDLMRNKGLIWASDRAAWRLRVLKERAARAKVFNYQMVAWPPGVELPVKTKFDGVLLDAPCSSLGTWHRNPHARWTTVPEDVRQLAEAQKSLLARVAQSVKPGGKLIYSVCTLTRAETIEVAQSLVQQAPDFEPLAVANPFDAAAAPAAQYLLRPEDRSGNGMFVALWRRSAPAGQSQQSTGHKETETTETTATQGAS
jgi:16S rRNA (cytosine967-C5)-methyltransferase